jgi:hypothetical protein
MPSFAWRFLITDRQSTRHWNVLSDAVLLDVCFVWLHANLVMLAHVLAFGSDFVPCFIDLSPKTDPWPVIVWPWIMEDWSCVGSVIRWRRLSRLREAEVALSKGQAIAEMCKQIGISEQTYYRRRKEYGGLKTISERIQGTRAGERAD